MHFMFSKESSYFNFMSLQMPSLGNIGADSLLVVSISGKRVCDCLIVAVFFVEFMSSSLGISTVLSSRKTVSVQIIRSSTSFEFAYKYLMIFHEVLLYFGL